MTAPTESNIAARTVVFISKATPGDDEFALWLAAAEGLAERRLKTGPPTGNVAVTIDIGPKQNVS